MALRKFFEKSSDKEWLYSNGVHGYQDDAMFHKNWPDERTQKEKETERLLKALANNELISQELGRRMLLLTQPTELTRSLDSFLHHGDIVRLKWSNQQQKKTFYLAASPKNFAENGTYDEPCWVTASPDSKIMTRNVVQIFRSSNFVRNSVPLTYGELILFCTLKETGQCFLNCEVKNSSPFARNSSHLELDYVRKLSGSGMWQLLSARKDDRLKTEGQYIPCNTDVVIHHVVSGQNLALEIGTGINTEFGCERRISVHSYIIRSGEWNDGVENIWQIEASF